MKNENQHKATVKQSITYNLAVETKASWVKNQEGFTRSHTLGVKREERI